MMVAQFAPRGGAGVSAIAGGHLERASAGGGHLERASAPKEVTTLEDAAHINGSPMDVAAEGSPVVATNEGSPVGTADKGHPVTAAAQRAPMKTVARQARATFR